MVKMQGMSLSLKKPAEILEEDMKTKEGMG